MAEAVKIRYAALTITGADAIRIAGTGHRGPPAFSTAQIASLGTGAVVQTRGTDGRSGITLAGGRTAKLVDIGSGTVGVVIGRNKIRKGNLKPAITTEAFRKGFTGNPLAHGEIGGSVLRLRIMNFQKEKKKK